MRRLEPLARKVASAEVMRHLSLELRGLRSSACVERIEELFRRQPGRLEIAVHPALVELWVAREFPLLRFASELERSGYQLSPCPGDRWMRSMIACFTLAGIGAALAPAFPGRTGPLALGGLALCIAGVPLACAAMRGLRRGVLVPELLLVVGLLAAGIGAAWSGGGLALMAALCLAGRIAHDRVLARQGGAAMSAEEAEGVLCRRIAGGRVELVSCGRIRRGDQLLIAPGELIPVEASADGAVDLVLDEGRLAPGERVPPGAWNAGSIAVRVTAARSFSASALGAALSPEQNAGSLHSIALLAAAAAGWALAGDGARGLEIAAAACCASSPAALALALLRRRVEARLRSEGLLVRRADFLERAASVRRVAFDRLAVTTPGALRFPEAVMRLSGEERAALAHLAVQSQHPRCLAVRRALAGRERSIELPVLDGAPVRVEASAGVELELAGSRYRLGAPRWAVERGAAPAAGLGFSRDGRLLAWLVADEELRAGARDELRAMIGHGLEPWLLSGDEPAHVAAAAGELGIACSRGGMRPCDKIAWLEERDRGDTLFLGDGVNDDDAGARAHASGTPSSHRPLPAAPSDFFLLRPGLAPVASALAAARELVAVTCWMRRLGGAATGAAIAISWAGVARPWHVAGLMPLAALLLAAAALRWIAVMSPGSGSRMRVARACPAVLEPAAAVATHS